MAQPCAATASTEPSSAAATASTEPSSALLFVIAAHITDDRNCDILGRTLRSIQCYHPGDDARVLVVDNESPAGNVEAAVAAARSIAGRVIIRREDTSRGQLGSWAVADRFLRASLRRPQSVILMQHSTVLAAPVHLPRGCSAAALAEPVNRTSGGSWLQAEEGGMRWATAVAEGLHVHCAAPCTFRTLPSRYYSSSDRAWASKRGPVLEWAAAAHAVLCLSWRAWQRLAAMRLWPVTEALGYAAPLRALAPLWRHAPCAEGGIRTLLPCLDSSTIKLHTINGGLEKLAGILLAKLNEDAMVNAHLDRDADVDVVRGRVDGLDGCFLPRGVLKVHGMTFHEQIASHRGNGSSAAKRRSSCAYRGDAVAVADPVGHGASNLAKIL